jgi:hypothetical protein
VIPEPYLGLIVGSILTLIVSVVSIILTNHYSERQWVKQRKLDENKRITEEVYSPLYMLLYEINFELGYIGGYIQEFLKQDITNKDAQTAFVEWAQDYNKKEKPSQLIKNILRTKLGLIKPIGFQRDIFYLGISLGYFEKRILGVNNYTFENQETSILKKRFQNYAKATAYYFHVSRHIMSFLDYLISNEGELTSDFKYKMILDATFMQRLNELHKGPLDKETEAEADKILDDALKEISNLKQPRTKKEMRKTRNGEQRS